MTTDPQRWRTLVLVYPVLNAKLGSVPGRRRAQRVMGRDERAAVEAVIERLPATVLDWSDGAATLDPLDIVEVRRPIGSMSSVGVDRWWVGPREVRQELREVAATGARYDSVIALWPGDPAVAQCGWGCTIGPSDATFGAGFTSISTDHWATLATDPNPEQGYVHEWLHQVEALYRALGLSEAELPSLHDAGRYTSTRGADAPPFGASYVEYHDGGRGRPPARTWAPWYRDWMTGRLRPIDGSASPGPRSPETGPPETGPGAGGIDLTAAAPDPGPGLAAPTPGLAAPTPGLAAPAPDASPPAPDASPPAPDASPPAPDASPPIGLTPERWALRDA